jgi:hypothetical protein
MKLMGMKNFITKYLVFLNQFPLSSFFYICSTQGGNKFLQFVNRYSSYNLGVAQSSGSGSPLWFSFNVGLVHYLVFCTEDVSAPLSSQQMADQIAFMTADLKAVDRAVTPWVVSVGHKAWSMDTLNWQPYEDVLNPGGVDRMF